MRSWKRLISLALVFTMLSSYVPAPVYAEEVVEETAWEAVEEITEEITEQTAEEVVEEITEQTAEEVVEEVMEETVEEVVEEVLEVTASNSVANAGAASEDEPALTAEATIVAEGSCGADGSDVTWRLDSEGTLTISGSGAMADYTYNENDDGDDTWTAPWAEVEFTSIVVEEGVTGIGDYAFYRNALVRDPLDTVVLADTVTSVGSYAFYCTEAKVTMSANLSGVGAYGFYACKIDALYQSVRAGERAFSNCSFENGSIAVSDAGMYAFAGSNGLKQVVLKGDPSAYAFYMTDLTELIVTDAVTAIGEQSFAYCSSLKDVYYCGDKPQTATDAFSNTSGCTDHRSSDAEGFADSVAIWADEDHAAIAGETAAATCKEGGYTLYSCAYCDFSRKAYDGTPLGEHVYEKGVCADCGDQEKVISGSCGEGLTWALGYDGTLTISGTGAMADFTPSTMPWYDYRDQILNIVIEDTVTKVGAYAFYGCTAAMSLTIGEGVTSIGNYAFYNNTGLYEINFRAVKMASLGSYNQVFAYAGDGGSGITVNFGEQVTRVPAYLFCPYSGSYRPNVIQVNFAEDSVTTIGSYAFYGCTALTAVDIPDSVTTIGGYAFYGCTAMTRLTIGEGVASIGNYAFYNCTGLTQLNYNAVSAGGKSSYNYVFYCAGQRGGGLTVTIGAQVKSIPSYLFCPYSSSSYYRAYITRLEFEEGSVCTTIGSYAFAYCDALKVIELPESLTSIGNGAFNYCRNLNQIDYNAVSLSNLNSSNYVFYYAGYSGSGITLNIGENVRRIPNYLFCPYSGSGTNSPNFVQVNFPEDSACTEIGNYAFAYNYTLKELTIPDSVTTIGNYALAYGRKLTVLFPNALPENLGTGWSNGTAVCVAPVEKGTFNNFSYWITQEGEAVIGKYLGSSSAVTIPGEISGCPVTALGGGTFYGCTSLSGVTLPEGLETLGNYTFYNCSSLSGVTLPESLLTIGNYSFSGCTNMAALTIPQAVNQLGSYFLNNTGVRHLRFTGDAPEFAARAFYSQTLTVNYPGNNGTWTAESMQNYGGAVTWVETDPDAAANGICGSEAYWNLSESGLLTIYGVGAMTNYSSYSYVPWYGYRSQITSVILEEGITSIGAYAFYGCTALTTVEAPDTLANVGQYAFYNCTNLTGNIILPEEMTAIGTCTYYNCYGLTGDLTIPAGVTSLGTYAFYNCYGLDGELVIPDTVTSLGSYAFQNCDGLDSLTIGSGLKTIPSYAFDDCDGLKSVDFGGVTSIDSYAFFDCGGLDGELVIPDTVTSLGSYAFRNCDGLDSLTIGSGLKTIPDYAFYDCDGLKSVDFGGVISINSYAFYDCSRLDGELVIPDTVTSLGTYAFRNCDGLDSLTIGSGLTSVPNSAFRDCDGLTSVTLGEKVASIGDSAFSSCDKLTGSLVFPDSVQTIGYNAFYYCTKLTSITFGTGLTRIGTSGYTFPFYNCTGVTEMIFNGTTPPANIYGDFKTLSALETVYVPAESLTAYRNKLTSLVNSNVVIASLDDRSDFIVDETGLLIAYQGAGGDIVIPENVTAIDTGVFKGNTAITSVVIPEGVTAIGASAFQSCSKLTSVTMADTVTSIGENAFSHCSGINTMNLSEGLTEIGDYAFYNCTFWGVSELVIPEGVSHIGTGAFANCDYLLSVDLNNVVTVGANAFNGSGRIENLTLSKELTTIGAYAFESCIGICNTLTIPETVTSIGEKAFQSCTSLPEVSFMSATVPATGSLAFGSCTALTDVFVPQAALSAYKTELSGKLPASARIRVLDGEEFLIEDGVLVLYNGDGGQVTIPDGVTSIGESAFSGCESVTAVTFPASVSTIGERAFSGSGLTGELTIPDTLTQISAYAFYDCDALESVQIGNGVRRIGEYAFYDCGSMTGLTLGSSVVSIGSYAFRNCGSLQGVLTIPDSVTVLGSYAFGNCVELDGLVLGDSLCSIGDHAFLYCRELTGHLTIPDSVLTIGSSAFSGCNQLTGLSLGSSLITIGVSAFDSCTKLDGALVIPDSVTKIDSYAFQNCTELDSLTLNDGLKVIGGLAFYRCAGLTGELVIPDSVTDLGNQTFADCTGLTQMTLGTGLSRIGRDVFNGCTALGGELIIPDNIYVIDYSAFKNTGFNAITFGENVTAVGSSAQTANVYAPFYGCAQVTQITFEGKTPPTFYGNSFVSMTQLQRIVVPAESHSAYVTALKSYVDENLITSDFTALKVSNLRAPQVYSKTAVLTWDAHLSPDVVGYRISRNGEEIAQTNACSYTDRDLEVGQSYTYTVRGYTEAGVQTPETSRIVTTAAPAVLDLWTPASDNKLNREKNTVSVRVENSGNLLPLGQEETVLELYYGTGEETCRIGQGQRSGTLYTVSWNMEGIADGEYTVTARLTDVDGTMAEYTETVEIDNSCPSALENVWASDNVTKIDLSWTRAREADVVAYRVYRSTDRQGEFTLLAQVKGLNTQTYSDTEVQTDGTYYYYITAVTELDAESPMSRIVGATLTRDETPPVINKLTPESGTYLTGKVTLGVDAEDNVQVAGVRLYYQSGSEWIQMTDITNHNLMVSYDTTLLPEGPVKIKAVAYDKEGNEAEQTWDYIVDNQGPDQVTGLSAESTSVTVTLRWNDVQAQDVSCFLVEQVNADDTVTRVNTVNATLGINIYDLTPGTQYTYQVTAYDLRGNRGETSAPITVSTLADTIRPVISMLRPTAGYYADTIPLRITASDDHNIAAIQVQVSQDLLSWTQVYSMEYSNISKERTLSYDLSLADYPEGSIFIRGITRDTTGNVSDSGVNAPYVQHIVDRTAPAAPENVKAIGGSGYIEIRWSQGSEQDLNQYSVYRSDAQDGSYTRLSSGLEVLNYADRTAEPNKTYYYKVCVDDKAGNVSPYSAVVSALMLPDNEAPEILSIYPLDGVTVGPGNGTVSISARDNSSLASIHFEYSTDGGVTYQTLEQVELETESASGYQGTKLPMEQLTHGMEVYVRVRVKDKAGNESKPKVVKYPIDREAPAATAGSVRHEADNDWVCISWKGKGESDLYRYRVYRCEGESETLLGYVTPESGKENYEFIDKNLSTEECTYTYRIEAVDYCGNSHRQDPLEVKLPDRSNPKAVIACDSTMNVGYEYIFDGSGSTDNGRIVSWHWDFGDGTVSAKEKQIHKYDKTGEYTVTLTVTDDKGLTGKATRQVCVVDEADVGTAVIYILDEAGEPVSGAPVYFDLGSENQTVKYTGNTDDLQKYPDMEFDKKKVSGAVVFHAEAGTYTVGCVKADNTCLPVKKEITITAGQTTVISMTLVKQPIVEGSFEVNRMTFEEIVAAGIDISQEESQHIVKLNVTLAYGTSQVIQTSFIYDVIDGDVIPSSGSSGGSIEVEDRVLTPVVLNPGNTEAMTIAFLDMPISASYLKEFFDVKLHIINNASTEFPMVNNTVTLNVPQGLALVEGTETEHSTTVTIPEIGGQTTKTVAWILRGDAAGDYEISADFTGTLYGFNETIEAKFKAPEAITVYGLDALKLLVEIDPSINYGTHYFNLSLENDSPVDVYLPSVDILGNVLDSYLIRINKEAENEEDISLTHKTPELTQLATVLENSQGAKSTLSADAEILSLAPGEKMTKRYAVYNVIDYNFRLLIGNVLAELEEGLGIRYQLILTEMDLYGTDNALEKLRSLNGDKQDMFRYIMDGSQFLYVRQATNRNDALLDSITAQSFAAARAEMALDQKDPQTVRDITRKLVGQMMVDEALGEAIDGAVHDKYSQYVDGLIRELQAHFGEKAYFQNYQGDEKRMKNAAKALEEGGLDNMMLLLAEQLKALGMTDEEGRALMEYAETDAFNQRQLEALKSLCGSHKDLADDLTGAFGGWQRDAELLQTFLSITAAYEQTMDLLNMLLEAKSLDENVRKELETLKTKLVSIQTSLMGSYGEKDKGGENGRGKEQTKQDLDEIFGSSPSKVFTQLMFGTLMDQLSYWNADDDSQLVLQVHTELSFAMTELLSGMMEDGAFLATTNEAAVRPLTALKYLIQLRLLGEQTFVFFGDALGEEQQYEITNWVFQLTGGLFPEAEEFSLDDYADYVLTLLLEYRDSIFITSTETLDIPEAPAVTIDYLNGRTVQSFSSEYEYSFTGAAWITGSGKPVSLNPGTVNKHLWIRKKATATEFAGNTTKLLIPARSELQGDVTVLYDQSQYIITGLAPGEYSFVLTNNGSQTNLSKTFTQDDSRVYRIEDAQSYVWLAIRAEATDSAFASQIRYVATEAPRIKWAMNKGYLTMEDLDTERTEMLQQLRKQGYPDASIEPNPKNKTDHMATGDQIRLEKDGKPVDAVVEGETNGDGLINEEDLNDIIQDVGTDDKKLEGANKEAGNVSGDKSKPELDIDDIIDEQQKVKKEKEKDKDN